MVNRFAYANPPVTAEDYQAAIEEAYTQAESLSEQSERLQAEADRWYDRAYTLELELDNFNEV